MEKFPPAYTLEKGGIFDLTLQNGTPEDIHDVIRSWLLEAGYCEQKIGKTGPNTYCMNEAMRKIYEIQKGKKLAENSSWAKLPNFFAQTKFRKAEKIHNKQFQTIGTRPDTKSESYEDNNCFKTWPKSSQQMFKNNIELNSFKIFADKLNETF